MRRRLVVVALLVGAALVVARIGGGVSFRRMAVVGYLWAGDLWAGEPTRRTVAGGLLVFDAAVEQDRQALVGTHGDLEVRPVPRQQAVQLTTGRDGELHEVCTRRIPRDWSGFRTIRLEYAAPRAGAPPVRVVLRIRNRAGLRVTRWYGPELFLEPGTTSREVALEPARRFVDPARTRQLCLALKPAGKGGRAQLALRRVLLGKRWTRPAPPPIGGFALAVVDDSNKLRRFDPLPAARAMFHAARNEVVGFQLVLRRGATGPASARVELEPFRGPDGRVLRHELFEEKTLSVREPSSVMFGWGSPGPGVYPDPLVPLEGELSLWHGNRMVWVDVHVPADAAPGSYAARVRVNVDGKVHSRELGLKVHPVRLSDEGRALVMVYYLPHLLRAALGVKGEAYHRQEAAYHRLFQAHGAYLVYDSGLPNLGRFLPAMNGSLYTGGPGKGRGAPYWPVGMRLDRRSAAQEDASAVVRWFDEHGLSTRPFVYLFDEPSSRADYEQIRTKAAWIHEAPPPGNRLAVMVTEQVAPEDPSWPSLVGSVDYWISPFNFPEPARTRRKTTKERFFPYFAGEPLCGADVIDTDGVSLRTWGWIAHIHDVELWFHWQGLYFRDAYNDGPRADLYADPVTYDQRRHGKDVELGNGSGTLAYPPARPGGPPVASLRLKLLRRGMQDRLLLRAAAVCGQEQRARKLARRLVPRCLGEAVGQVTAWPKGSDPWVEARIELLRRLSRCGGWNTLLK